MRSLKLFDRRVKFIAAGMAVVLAAQLSVIVSAAQATDRSIALSSSSKGATNVTYDIKFKAVGAAAAFVVDFCSDSPLIGSTCTQPTGFSAASAASASSGVTNVAQGTSKIVVDKSINAGDNVDVVVTAITNPSASGPLYARIVTYSNAATADNYTSTNIDPGSTGDVVDQGAVAISITDTVGVSGAVLESMIFCVAGQVISENCDLSGNTPPTLKLGKSVGGAISLESDAVYTGSVYTQLSTNAVNGAVVSLKSNASGCGGLVRQGATSNAAGCGILPANATNGFDIAAAQAKFGVKTGTAAGAGTNYNGTVRPFDSGSGAYYSTSAYKLRFVSGDTDGITSTYGDPILDTNGAPVNNMGMPLTFGASVSNSTPAGLYSADLSLIATGKF